MYLKLEQLISNYNRLINKSILGKIINQVDNISIRRNYEHETSQE